MTAIETESAVAAPSETLVEVDGEPAHDLAELVAADAEARLFAGRRQVAA